MYNKKIIYDHTRTQTDETKWNAILELIIIQIKKVYPRLLTNVAAFRIFTIKLFTYISTIVFV